MAGISLSTNAELARSEKINRDVLVKICQSLKYDWQDIIESVLENRYLNKFKRMQFFCVDYLAKNKMNCFS
mgnify:CR=1 FL=1